MPESACCRTSLITGIYYKKLGLVTAAPTFGPKVRPQIDFTVDHCEGRLAVVKSVRPVEQAKTEAERNEIKTRQGFM